jgi:hypothetical protein
MLNALYQLVVDTISGLELLIIKLGPSEELLASGERDSHGLSLPYHSWSIHTPQRSRVMSKQRFEDLPTHQQRLLVLRSCLLVAAISAALLVAYSIVPIRGGSNAGEIVRLTGTIVLLAAVLGWQTRSVLLADYPLLRAVESVAIAVPVLLCLFAAIYLSLSTATPTAFSEPLNRVGAFYFTVTVFSTVGFGDITPKTDLARIVVTTQMLLDLALLATVVRVYFGAARMGAARQSSGGGDSRPVGEG